MQNHTKVIMPHVHIMRHYDDQDGKHIVVTGVLLNHLIENLILSGALEVIITDGWRYSKNFDDELGELPESAKRYVKVVDAGRRTRPITDELFEPILDEFGIEFSGGAYMHKRAARSDQEEAARTAAMHAHSLMPRFLEALFYKAHFHFDISYFLHQLTLARWQSKNPDSRVKLAGLEAVLSSYQPFDVSAALVVPGASKAHATRLMEIVLSSEYKALSAEGSALGGLTNIPHVVSKIDLSVKKLLNMNSAKGILGYSSKAATAATGVPVPTTDLAETLVQDAFLPPTLDMSEIISKAKRELSEGDANFEKKKYLGL